VLPIVLKEIESVSHSYEPLFVSIAAGVSLETIESRLGKHSRVVRVMPNTLCLVGHTSSAFSAGRNATKKDLELVEKFMSSVGVTFLLEEKLLDAVTGLSGSGPAYVFIMIEALADGGVKAGLPRRVAVELAAKTVLGAAEMILKTGSHPGALKDAVASPGGTTIAGIHELEKLA